VVYQLACVAFHYLKKGPGAARWSARNQGRQCRNSDAAIETVRSDSAQPNAKDCAKLGSERSRRRQYRLCRVDPRPLLRADPWSRRRKKPLDPHAFEDYTFDSARFENPLPRHYLPPQLYLIKNLTAP
jgi:hypothetical protein